MSQPSEIIPHILLASDGDYFVPEVREIRPITDDDLATMRESNPGIDDDNLRSMLMIRRDRERSSCKPPRGARADDRIYLNIRLGTYLGTQAVWLRPGAGALNNFIVIEDYGVMGRVPKTLTTFGALEEYMRVRHRGVKDASHATRAT